MWKKRKIRRTSSGRSIYYGNPYQNSILQRGRVKQECFGSRYSQNYKQSPYYDYADDPDDFNTTLTGRILHKIAASMKKTNPSAIVCNNFTYEPCKKEGVYYNVKTGEQLDICKEV